jgi:cholesterol oxidase
MAAVSDALGGKFIESPLSHLRRVITVHPLGGASMGASADVGVVDAYGEAFGHPGLFVVDGSAMPGSVGANPSLTIAAFADRAAERILEKPRSTRAASTSSVEAPLPGAATRQESATSVQFTEDMKGFFTLGEKDPAHGYQNGKHAGTSLMFHLTIRTDDVDRFVRDPKHTGTTEGWVDAPSLGGRLTVQAGEFNLFVTETPVSRRMLYRLFFADAAGNPLTLSGFKEVRDDPGFDLWPDTSTLYTTVYAGHVTADQDAQATVVGAGVLHIHLLDFAKQMTTFRASGPSAAAGARGLLSFGRLFMGELWDVYAHRAPEPREATEDSIRLESSEPAGVPSRGTDGPG